MPFSTIHIDTGYNKSFEWFTNDTLRFIGYFYSSDGEYMCGDAAMRYFSDCQNFDSLKTAIDKANGIYSLIIKLNDSVCVASDKSRFFPVFYTQNSKALHISDNIYKLASQSPELSLDSVAKDQFLSGAFVLGNRSLFATIFQVQAGELIEFSKGHKTQSWFKSLGASLATPSESSRKMATDSLHRAGLNLANSIKNKHVLLPLSGGYDSRLIACWLKSNKVENVTCFTFGRKGTKEIEISRRVAHELGYEWHAVEYTEELINGYIDDPEFHEFYKYMSRATSMFFMQEYFAVRELKRRGIIKDGFVAIPGHSGDLLAGSQLYKLIPPKTTIHNPSALIRTKVFNQLKLNNTQKTSLENTIDSQINRLKSTSDIPDYMHVEEWLIREKLAKYNFNSSHVFTFFGGEVRFPFWDDNLMQHWLSKSLGDRLFCKQFNAILETDFFATHSVNFAEKLQPSKRDLILQKFKEYIKSKLSLKTRQHYLKNNDWPFYDEITRALLKQLENKGVAIQDNGSSYAYRILNWYLLKLEEEFLTTKPNSTKESQKQ